MNMDIKKYETVLFDGPQMRETLTLKDGGGFIRMCEPY
jgi:hypothetical protein